MRGVDNQLKVNERVQIPFIDLFKDKLSNNGPIPAPVDEPMPLGDSVSLSEQWYSGQLNSTISYYFLDDVAFGHPLLRDFIQT
ncbi:MAG: hypothetical protein VW397_01560, partial [Candidatus Margulisiibacteriota bacterium]